jgi:hypothetical protein
MLNVLFGAVAAATVGCLWATPRFHSDPALGYGDLPVLLRRAFFSGLIGLTWITFAAVLSVSLWASL